MTYPCINAVLAFAVWVSGFTKIQAVQTYSVSDCRQWHNGVRVYMLARWVGSRHLPPRRSKEGPVAKARVECRLSPGDRVDMSRC